MKRNSEICPQEFRKSAGKSLPDDVEKLFVTAIDRLYRHAHSESIKRGIRMKKVQREKEQNRLTNRHKG